MDSGLYDKQVVTTPGAILATNTVYQTNVVVVSETKTNLVTGDITPPVFRQIIVPTITYDYAPAITVTNLVPRAGISSIITGAGALPLPFAGTAAALLGWAYSFYASVRNKKVAAGVVQSVQQARNWLQTTPEGTKIDEQIKAILAAHQDSAGIAAEVNKLLAQYVDKK